MTPSRHPSPWGRWAWIMALGLVLTNCALCERVEPTATKTESSATLAELIPANAQTAVFVGDWKALRDGVAVVDRQLGQDLPVGALLSEVNRKFGLDLQDMQKLQQAGVRTQGGVAFAKLGEDGVLLVPVEAPKLFEPFVATVAQNQWGAAATPTKKPLDQTTITIFYGKDAQGQPDPKQPILAYAIHNGTAILFPGPTMSENKGDAEATLSGLIRLKPEASLGKTEDFAQAKATLGADYPILGLVDLPTQVRAKATELKEYTYSKKDGEALDQMANELGRLSFGVKFDEQQAKARVLVPMKGGLSQRYQTALKARAPFEPLLKVVDGAPALALHLAVEPEKALDELMILMSSEARQEMLDGMDRVGQHAKLDVRKDLVPLLDGHVLILVPQLTPEMLGTPDLISFIKDGEGSATFGLKDRAALLAKLDGVAQSAGDLIKREDRNGTIVYSLGGDDAFARFALGPNNLTISGRKLAVDALVKRASAQGTGPQGTLQQAGSAWLQGQDRSGLMLDPQAILQGLGPLGAKAGFLKGFSAWSLALAPTDKGVSFDLVLGFQPKAKPQQP